MARKSRETDRARDLGLRKTTRYRDRQTGRFLPGPGPRGRVITETWLIGPGGEQLRDVTEPGYSVRTATVPKSGKWQGHLGFAMGVSGAFRKLKGAKKVTVTVKGKDFKDKARRIKIVIDVKNEKKLQNLMVGKVQEAMYRRGFRPQYALENIPWADRKVSKSFARGHKQLRNVRVIVEVENGDG